MLSKKSLELLQAMFAENSNVNLPVGLAEQVIEIREFVKDQLSKPDPAANIKNN